jgi:hypothetical protein
MALRVEFDPLDKILLLRFEGALTDESIADFYRVIRQHWTAADARMGIVDFSTLTDFALSSDLLHQLAKQEPCIPDPTGRPRVIVAPQAHVFGLARMFQIMGETTRPLLHVVHTLDEAFAKLGVQSPRFELLA